MIGILCNRACYDNTPEIHKYSELSGINFDSHIVVSCAQKNVKRLEDYLNRKGILFLTLPVSFAFHSSFLDPVEKMHKELEKNALYRTPKIPFISCTYARKVSAFDAAYSWDVFRKPILFQKTIQALEKDRPHIYIDLGTAGTLSNFVKYILADDSHSETFAALSPWSPSRRNLEKIQRYLLAGNKRA